MKSLIKIINEEIQKIFEIGEATAPTYPYNEDVHNGYKVYRFETEDHDKYVVNVHRDIMLGKDMNAWVFEFGTVGDDPKNVDYKRVVNKGKMFKVMSTVTTIIKNFASVYKPNIVAIQPSRSKGDTDQRRFNMYYQFISKNLTSNYIVNEFPRESVIVILNRDILADTSIITKLKEVLKDKFRFTNVNKGEGTREQMANLLRMHYGDRVK